MRNIEYDLDGEVLHIRIDLSKSGTPSASGKSLVIASTEGNKEIASGTYLGLNVYKKRVV